MINLEGVNAYKSLDIDPTGAVIVAGGTAPNKMHRVWGYHFTNEHTAIVFVKFYNKATAPTENDTPVMVLGIPPNSAGAVVTIPGGVRGFANGIGIRCTTGKANNSTADPGAGLVCGTVWYK